MQADARLPADANLARHDIVIVGGGLVGASLAIALDGLGLDVAMVEATLPGTLPPVFDERAQDGDGKRHGTA